MCDLRRQRLSLTASWKWDHSEEGLLPSPHLTSPALVTQNLISKLNLGSHLPRQPVEPRQNEAGGLDWKVPEVIYLEAPHKAGTEAQQ